MNWRVASVLFTLISAVMAGICFTVALILGHEDPQSMILSVLTGLGLSLPVTYVVTRQLMQFTAGQQPR